MNQIPKTIKESIERGSDQEKEAMLRAGEEILESYVKEELTSLLNPLLKIDRELLSEDHRVRVTRLIGKLQALLKIASSNYEGYSIQQVRGLKYVHKGITGEVSSAEPNGKYACQINMWSGMDKFEIDPKKLDTHE